MRKWLGLILLGLLASPVAAQNPVSVVQWKTAPVDVSTGTVSTGTIRVVIATDQAQLTNALKVDGSAVTQPVSGTVTAAQATAANLNATVVGTGTFAVQAAQSGNFLVQGVAAHDAASSGNPVLLGCYASAAAPTNVSADGDATNVWCLRNGAISFQPTFAGVLGVAGNGASGTGVQRVTIANDSTGIIALTTSTAQIGHLEANQSTNIAQVNGVTTLAGTGAVGTGSIRVAVGVDTATVAGSTPAQIGVYVEDAAETAGGNLSMAGTVRRDAAASSAGTDGDNATLNTDALGRLWVNCGTGCSGGTQYTQDAALTVATTVGTMAMGRASAAAPTDVSADNDAVIPWYLRNGSPVVNIASGGALIGATSNALDVNIKSGGGSGGTAIADRTAFTYGTTVFTPVGGVYNSSITSLTSGQAGAAALTPTRDVHVALYDASGNAVTPPVDATTNTTTQTTGPQIFGNGSAATPSAVGADGRSVAVWTDLVGRVHIATEGIEDAAETAAAPLNMVGTVRRDTQASSAGTTGDNATLNTDATGNVWVTGTAIEDAAETVGGTLAMAGSVRRDTAASSAGTTGDNATVNTDVIGLLWTRHLDPCDGVAKTPVSVSISTATTTVLVAASASNKLYVCSLMLIASAADNVALVEDASGSCASPDAGMSGGTTSGTGWNLAANSGFAFGSGAATVAKTASTNVNVCLITSTTAQLSGTLMYVLAP